MTPPAPTIPLALPNLSGALVPESISLLSTLASGVSVNVLREQALNGRLLHQRARETRRRIWQAVQVRYLGLRPPWKQEVLLTAIRQDPSGPSTKGLLYLHYMLSEPLVQRWATGPLWARYLRGDRRIGPTEVLADLEQISGLDRLPWTQSCQRKLASSLLTALRDFGLATGARVKRLERPIVTPLVAETITRCLIEGGERGAGLIDSPQWRLYFLGPEEVVAALTHLSHLGRIRFERAGSTVVLETPWSAP